MWWPLTLNYIFKVSRPWLKKSCPLCSVYSSGWIHFRCGTNYYYHYRVCRVIPFFFRICKFEFLAIFKKFSALTVKKIYSCWWILSILVQMITSMRRCVACDDLWPWRISSRSFDLDFENRVRSVTFSVLDRLFPYLPQIITAIRGCVTY